MASPTYDKIASIVLDSSASSVTFDDIPTTDANSNSYRDLIVVASGSSTSTTQVSLRLNGDSGSNYSFVDMVGTGSSTSSNASGSQTSDPNGVFSTGSSLNIWQIMDYSATDAHKTILSRIGEIGGWNRVRAGAARWANTAAVYQVTLTGGTFQVGSAFDLYAIAG